MLDVLIKARDYITDPSYWCTGHFFQPLGDDEYACCARGAIKLMSLSNDDEPYCKELAKDLPDNFSEKYADYRDEIKVALYNNQSTHEMVLDLFDRTIIRLKRQQTIDSLLETSESVEQVDHTLSERAKELIT